MRVKIRPLSGAVPIPKATSRIVRVATEIRRAEIVSLQDMVNLAKYRSPVKSARMKRSIRFREEESGKWIVGTEVRAAAPLFSVWSWTAKTRPGSRSPRGRMMSAQGYPYPWLQETVDKFKHPQGGQSRFLRSSVHDRFEEMIRRIKAAMKRGWGGS